jgi:hypothetical protein
MIQAVAVRPPPAFRQVQADGARRAPDLIAETPVPDAEPLHGTPERPNQIETDFKSIEHD